MVICKYFLNGSCYYGSKCRFEHVQSHNYNYNQNYNSGHSQNYNSGHSQNYNSSHSQNYNSGHSPNYNSGHSPNYNSGHSPNYNSGHSQNYNSGHSQKYNSSHTHNQNQSQNHNLNPYVYDVRQKSGVSILQREAFNPPSVPAPRYTPTNTNTPVQVTSQKQTELSQYINMMVKEVNQIEHENMWPLTCLGIIKGTANLPGWVDYSPEELRWEAYKYQKEGQFESYIMGVKTQLNKAKELRSVFVQPSKMGESILREYMNQMKSPEENTVSQPMFGSVFKQQDSALNTFSFSLAQNPAFSQPSQPAFPLNQPPSDGFLASRLSAPNMFSQVPVDTSPFGALPYNQDMSASSRIQLAQNASYCFGQAPILVVDTEGYTNMTDLSPEEYEQFTANTFTIGKIPLRPPPRELCNS